MWALTNDYSLSNIAGGRPLGNYTEVHKRIQLLYNLAQQLSNSGGVFADIDPSSNTYKLGQGDKDLAMAYGLKPYIVAADNEPQSLVNDSGHTIDGQMAKTMLRSILHRIVEEA